MAGPRKIRATASHATVEIDQAELIALADRLTEGAVRTFLDAAHRQIDPVVNEARTNPALWPRKTGASQSATTLHDRINKDSVEAGAFNRVPYTYKLRFSVMTTRDIDTESRQVAARTWGKLRPYVERVNPTNRTLRGPYKGKGGAKERAAHHFIEQASDGLWTKWWLKGTPSLETIRRGHKGNLIGRHGTGAPSDKVAGKHVWSTVIRNPLKKREPALIAEARDALDRLAKG